MTVQYWVDDFFVDVSRNQITRNGESQTVAPKTLAVLTYLANHQGTVISQETLLNEVWHDAVVSPNTLQKSIAHLRKALGDDAKRQAFIKTHAKQGYSLEAVVRFQAGSVTTETPTEPQAKEARADAPPVPNETPAATPSLTRRMVLLAGIVMAATLGFWVLSDKTPRPMAVHKIQSLTATDDKEFDADYSPDGRFIVFHRYNDTQCVNKLWAKNIATQQEHLLTPSWGAYKTHSLSQDGKTLVILANAPCDGGAPRNTCYDLVRLDFDQALTNPQEPDLLLRCENTQLKNPRWLNNDQIVLLQKIGDRRQLIVYSISKNQSETLYDPDEGILVDFDVALAGGLIAVVRMGNDGLPHLDMLTADGMLLSRNRIEMPPEAPSYRPLFPSFDPRNDRLVFSTGRQLFTLSYDGRVDKVAMPYGQVLMLPEFHPEGKRLLMITGPVDSDVLLTPLAALAGTPSDGTAPVFERSILGEDSARFQPGGDLIAFWSDRSGDHQIWLSDGHTPRQLTKLPMDTAIGGYDWAQDGASLLMNAGNRLVRVDLDGNAVPIPLEHPVIRLFQWDSRRNNALLSARIDGAVRLCTYDLNGLQPEEVFDGEIGWAHRSDTGRLVYQDQHNQFWQPGPAEVKRIKPLSEKGAGTKVFRVVGDVVYAINRDKQLWRYHLETEQFEVLGRVGEAVSHLTDVNQTHVLMSTLVSSKKEVVELHLEE